MNNKGFMMSELIVVAAIVLITLTGLYVSYNKIISIYKQRIGYYDVPTMYELGNVRDNIDFSTTNISLNKSVYNNEGKRVYYINKYDIGNLVKKVSNETFKDYLKFLEGSLDIENLEITGKKIDNILIMENCDVDGNDVDGKSNCKYAYLEVLNETE